MQFIELCKRGNDEVVAYACFKCGTVAGSVRMHGDDAARELATKHCGPWQCRVCGLEHDWAHQAICRKCWRQEADAKHTARIEAARARAVEVPCSEYDGWVSDGDEGFWPTVEDALEISTADMGRLQAVLDDWRDSVGIESWETDFSRVIILDEQR